MFLFVLLLLCCCCVVVVLCCCCCVVVAMLLLLLLLLLLCCCCCCCGCGFGLRRTALRRTAWRLRGRRGFTQQPENSKRAHLRPWRFKTPPKFHEKTPRETQKERNGGGRGKKKREILGLPPFGAPPFGAPPFGAGLAEVGQLRLAKVGQIFLAKVGLAKVGIGQSRPIRMAKVGLAKVGLSHCMLGSIVCWGPSYVGVHCMLGSIVCWGPSCVGVHFGTY